MLVRENGLQVFRSGIVAVLTVNLPKYFLLDSLFILTTKLHKFLLFKISTALSILFASFFSCKLFRIALRSDLLTWDFWLPRNNLEFSPHSRQLFEHWVIFKTFMRKSFIVPIKELFRLFWCKCSFHNLETLSDHDH